MSDPVLTLLGFLFVFVVLGAAEAVRRTGLLGEEGTRKLVHIGVGHWIILALAIQDVRWAVVAPIVFIVLNYLSYRKGLFRAMERRAQHGGLGTVYYSVALTVVVVACFRTPSAGLRWAGAAGILTMAWGDGLAAVVGERWGRRRYTLTGSPKSMEGSLAMFLAGLLVLLVCARCAGVRGGVLPLAGTAALATALEALSPAGTDNLSVPLVTAFAFAAMV